MADYRGRNFAASIRLWRSRDLLRPATSERQVGPLVHEGGASSSLSLQTRCQLHAVQVECVSDNCRRPASTVSLCVCVCVCLSVCLSVVLNSWLHVRVRVFLSRNVGKCQPQTVVVVRRRRRRRVKPTTADHFLSTASCATWHPRGLTATTCLSPSNLCRHSAVTRR